MSDLGCRALRKEVFNWYFKDFEVISGKYGSYLQLESMLPRFALDV